MKESRKNGIPEKLSGALSPENPAMMGLAWAFDMLVLSVVTVAACIPVVTAGAALVAMHYCLFHRVNGDDGEVFPSFVTAFRQNFIQSTIMWMLILAQGTAVILLVRNKTVPMNSAVYGLLVVYGLVLAGVLSFLLPVLGRYENGLAMQLKLAVQMAILYLPKTAGMLVLEAGFAAFCRALPIRIGMLAGVVGLAPISYFIARLYVPAFLAIEKIKFGNE